MSSIELIITNTYPELSQAEQTAATYFLQHKEQIFQYPLSTLARLSGTSPGAWVRFCKSIGFDGIKSLKNALFQELNQSSQLSETETELPVFSDIKDFDSIATLINHVTANSTQAITATMRTLDPSAIDRLVDLILNARTIRCFGIAASGLVAEDLSSKFLRLGYPCLHCRDTHEAYTLAAAASQDDIAVIFSNSGKTPEILKTAHILKKTNTPIIAITGFNNDNLLAKEADYILYTNSYEALKRSSATSSRIAQLCVSDVLYMAIANRDYSNVEAKLEASYHVCRHS